MPGSDKILEPITQKAVAARYMLYLQEFGDSVSGYVEKKDLNFEFNVDSLDSESLIVKCRPCSFFEGIGEKFDLLTLTEPKDLTVRFSFAVDDVQFFISGTIHQVQGPQFSLKIQLPIHKLQRRDSFRIKIDNKDENTSLTIPREGKFEVFNISASGIGILAPIEKTKVFPEGIVHKKAELKFAGATFLVDLEIANIALDKKEKGSELKIGFRFVNPPKNLEQLIAKEAYLHSQKTWKRWL